MSATPTSLTLRTESRVLEISFDDGSNYCLPFEFLRVYSPSAEVRGHGRGQETLQTGKRLIAIESMEPVGQYAVQPLFSDGHNSGIFSWEYLYWLGTEQPRLWQEYLDALTDANANRDDPMVSAGSSTSSCGS